MNVDCSSSTTITAVGSGTSEPRIRRRTMVGQRAAEDVSLEANGYHAGRARIKSRRHFAITARQRRAIS
jgi:hypothetical protein